MLYLCDSKMKMLSYISYHIADFIDPTKWEEQFKWLIDIMLKMRKAF